MNIAPAPVQRPLTPISSRVATEALDSLTLALPQLEAAKHMLNHVYPPTVVDALNGYLRVAGGDSRIAPLREAVWSTHRSVEDFLDDDEGNVREEIAAMSEQPGAESWETVQSSLGMSLVSLGETRDSVRGAIELLQQLPRL